MRRFHLLIASIVLTAATIPDTIPSPPINGDNGYRIGVTNLDTGTLLWSAPYLYTLPYVAGSGWLAGDRVGYGCAYGFLQLEGEIIGRFTFRAIPEAASYMRINDTYMDEGQRYYDGSPTPAGTQQVPPLECPAVTETYETVQTPDERPVVVFWHGDQAVEIRDYRTVNAAAGVTFDVVAEIRTPFTVHSTVSGDHVVNNRIGVVAREAGIPEAVVYYDALNSGSMFPVEAVNPDDCNAIVSMSQGRQVYVGAQFAEPPASPLEASTGEQWMLLFQGGKTLGWWTLASHWDTLQERHRCGTDAEIDLILFIFDPYGSQNMTANLQSVLNITAARYPNAVTYLSLLVGGEGHVICQKNGIDVRASVTHAARIGEMTMPEAGPDIDVPCSGYSDTLGHLTTPGAIEANGEVAAWFNGS